MKRRLLTITIIFLVLAQFFMTVEPVQAAVALVVKADRTQGMYYTDAPFKVALSSYPGSVIVYTTNGTIPNAKISVSGSVTILNGIKYTGALTIKGVVNIKAISLLNWYTPISPVASFSYNIKNSAPSRTNGTKGIYYLPWNSGIPIYVSRAGVDHGNAIDFILPKDTTVRAARGGTITKIIEKYSATGCISTLPANYVEIKDTATGEISRYLHLKTNSVPDSLAVGKVINRGTIIGLSSNVGYSCGQNGGYHLHFEVLKDGKRLIPFFADVQGGTVYSSKSYTPRGEIVY